MLALDFRITGEDYRKVIAWRTAAEMTIIQHALKTRGRTMVIFRNTKRGRMRQITHPPEPGSCEPYVGESGGANSYVFQPKSLDGGCGLRVSRNSNGVFGAYPDEIPALNTRIQDFPRWVVLDQGGSASRIDLAAESESTDAEAMVFRIMGVELVRFMDWASNPSDLSLYTFRFTPTHVATLIHVTRCADGVELDLTENMDW
jgi:hypothetical protein